MRRVIVCCVLGFLWLTSTRADAQSRPPEGSPAFVETHILTVGGITYFRHVSRRTEWCERIGAYPATREGTNVTLAIQKEGLPQGSICICNTVECGPVPPEDITSVLGALAPGTYRLRILSTNLNFGGGPLLQVTAMDRTFVVEPGSEPTLAIARPETGNSLHVSVNGVTNVNYVFERSADLVSWTAIHTNAGAPFVHTLSPGGTHQFYRVSISQLPLYE